MIQKSPDTCLPLHLTVFVDRDAAPISKVKAFDVKMGSLLKGVFQKSDSQNVDDKFLPLKTVVQIDL